MSQRRLAEEIQVFISKAVFTRRWVARLVAYRSCLVRLVSIESRGCIQRETWDMGPSAGADCNLTLSHSRLRSRSFPPQLHRKRGGVGKVSPIGWAHLYLSAYNGTTNRKR